MNQKITYLLERILNEKRGFLINDTTDYTEQTNIAGLVVLEDTVISNLEINDGDDTDVLTAMKIDTETLTTSFPPIMAGGDGVRFSRVKLTSGAVWAVTTNNEGAAT
jgi:hypothetical protein